MTRFDVGGAGSGHPDITCDPAKSHCWSHDRDERVPRRAFITCFECGHVFTKRTLRRDHRKHFPRRARLSMFFNQRVEDITCCPHCIHDW